MTYSNQEMETPRKYLLEFVAGIPGAIEKISRTLLVVVVVVVVIIANVKNINRSEETRCRGGNTLLWAYREYLNDVILDVEMAK